MGRYAGRGLVAGWRHPAQRRADHDADWPAEALRLAPEESVFVFDTLAPIAADLAEESTVICLADPDQRIFDHSPGVDEHRLEDLRNALHQFGRHRLKRDLLSQ